MKFTTLSLIASIFISTVFATHAVQEDANQVAQVGPDSAEVVYVTKRHNHFSRRKITNLLAQQRKVCNHRNHKTYKASDDHKKHLKTKNRTQTRPKRVQHVAPARPQRVQSGHCAGVSHGCSDGGIDHEVEYNNDFAEDEFVELDGDDDDFYECDECDACDSDDDDDDERHMSSSDWDDETT